MDPATSTPLTLGVFGRWGSGKTSLMQLMRQQVEAKLKELGDDHFKVETPQTL